MSSSKHKSGCWEHIHHSHITGFVTVRTCRGFEAPLSPAGKPRLAAERGSEVPPVPPLPSDKEAAVGARVERYYSGTQYLILISTLQILTSTQILNQQPIKNELKTNQECLVCWISAGGFGPRRQCGRSTCMIIILCSVPLLVPVLLIAPV